MKSLKFFVFISVFAFSTSLFSQDKAAYKFFNSKSKSTDYEKLLKECEKADIVFFGELHNSPICHWLQLELTQDLFKVKKEKLVLGAEMYEADNQLIINELLAGKITDKNFKDEAKLWPNNETDYKPLLSFAKTNKLKFIATNIPRRYAAMVNKRGLESLDSLEAEAKFLIAPLPIKYDSTLSGYKKMLESDDKSASSHITPNLPKAQAIKDATMAYFIYKNLIEGGSFIHYNGTYHSENYQGILWYLKLLNPNLKIVTIASTEQESIEKLDEESENMADFILCMPENMTKTR